MKGIDTSHYQGDRGLINWSKVKNSGIEFAFLKCSQGTNFKDRMFERDRIEARKVGLILGFYHFAGNYVNGKIIPQDPTREADYFLKAVGDLESGEMLVLDWETSCDNPSDWCYKFINRIKECSGITPLFYSYQAKVLANNWNKISDCPLWEARYSRPDLGKMGTPPNAGNFGKWIIWQYSSKGQVDGIVGNVDLDYCILPANELLLLGKKKEEKPKIEKFLIHPVKESSSDPVYITQKFGENKAVYKRFSMEGHNGIDYRTRFWDSPLGHRYIVASKEGKVIEVKDEGRIGYGRYIRMEHDLDRNGNEQTIYGHLKRYYVKVGDRVKQGQRIGLSDNTGFSTGAHLHFGYRPKGWSKIYNNGFKGYVDQLPFIK